MPQMNFVNSISGGGVQIVAIFTMATRAVIDAWQQTQNTITNTLLDQSAKGGVLGKIASMILGVDMQEERRKADELNRKLGLGPQNVTEDAKRAAREQSSATADAARGWLDSLDRSFQEQSDAAGADLGERLATGGPSEAVKQLQDELAELRKQAAAAREAAQSGNAQLPGLGPDVAAIGGGATSSAFSAGGALALGFGGGGGGPQERMVKAAEATTKKLDVLHQDVVSLKDKRDDGLYDIVFMERPALIVKFVTNGNRNPAATALTGTVVIAYQHGDRLPPGMDQYGNITIQDVEKLFPRALNGGIGLAIWNDLVGIYQCLTVQQQCVLARAQINDTGGMGAVGYITISNFAACSPSPFNQVPSPAPTQAINFFLHRARYQDDVLIAWDEASTDWIVIDVQKKSLDLITDIRLKSDKTQIQVKQVRCAVEYQDDPNDPLRWIDKIPLKKCPTGSPLQ